MLQLASCLAFAAGVTIGTVDSTELRREELMAALRNGGYTVLLRHARTDHSFKEEIGSVPKERSAQRNLTSEGVHDSKLMGFVFQKYGISFGEVLASPMYRTVETAEHAARRPDTTMMLRTFPPDSVQGALVATPPRPGTNRLLVTHHFVIETHVPGVEPGDVAESEAAVVQHTADGRVELVGRITLDDWMVLATGKQAATEEARTSPHHGSGAPAGYRGGHNPGDASSTAFPDTPAGRLAKEYIAAFNTGDPARMRAFIESFMTTDASRPIELRLQTYTKLFEEHGPLAVTAVHTAGSNEVVLGMRSKRGGFRLTVTRSESQPGRAASVSFAIGGHR